MRSGAATARTRSSRSTVTSRPPRTTARARRASTRASFATSARCASPSRRASRPPTSRTPSRRSPPRWWTTPDVDRKAYEKARELEKAGRGDEALRAFREAGAIDDVGRLLAAARRYREAGEVLFGSLAVRPGQAGQLEPALRKRALSAAIWLAKGGETQVSVELFVALGERQRAVETLQRAGDQVGAARLMAGERLDAAPSLVQARQVAVGGAPTNLLAAQKLESAGKLDLALDAYLQLRRHADAARVARQLGRIADAAQLYADAGLPLEAAECYLAAGDTGKALDNLVRVPRNDPRYRPAAVRAVQLASSLNALGFQLEHFVGPFVAKGPQSDAELEAF